MLLAPELEALLPTDEEVASYQEHGWFRSKKIIPDDAIEAAIRGAERHWAGERDWALPEGIKFADWKPSDGGAIRNSEYTALQNREIRALIALPIIGAIAARLASTPVIRLWDDQLISKPTSTGSSGPVVGWHTDRAYWMTCTSEEMLTAWIPLQDTPEEMGPVTYIDGSHLWPETEGLRTFNSQDMESLEGRFGGADTRSLRRVMAMERGQVSFHHSRMIHGSDVNRGAVPRMSIALHMQDDSNRYRTFLNEDGVAWHITNDDLARKGPDGQPDYTDPAVFPVLWSATD